MVSFKEELMSTYMPKPGEIERKWRVVRAFHSYVPCVHARAVGALQEHVAHIGMSCGDRAMLLVGEWTRKKYQFVLHEIRGERNAEATVREPAGAPTGRRAGTSRGTRPATARAASHAASAGGAGSHREQMPRAMDGRVKSRCPHRSHSGSPVTSSRGCVW